MIIKKTIHDNTVQEINFDESDVLKMADHIVKKKMLSKHQISIYDTNGDGKITMADLLQRIKDLEVSGTDTSRLTEQLRTSEGVLMPPPPPF